MMFAKNFVSTIKNLLRSKTFWMCLVLYGIIIVWDTTKVHFSRFDFDLMMEILDTDPRFVLGQKTFYKLLGNTPELITKYLHPLVMIFLTSIIVTRDYNDRFFEIEKASGIKPSVYLLSRITALISLGYLVLVIASMVSVHVYVATRGGVDGVGLWDYITDSTVRILWLTFFKGLPCTIFFICVTYAVGALAKNSIAATIVPSIYTFAVYFHDLQTAANNGILLEYLCHYPTKVINFFYFYKVPGENHEEFCRIFGTSLGDVVLCIGFLVGVSAIGCVISYLRVRKRNT